MVWGWYSAAASSIVAATAYQKAGEESIRNLAEMYLRNQRETEPYLSTLPLGKPAAPTYPTECPSCHSHEFRMHHGRWLCSFCRSSAP